MDDQWKRAFYENECLKGNWSVRQLQRQIGSLLYERTGLSTDKKAVIEAARKQVAQAPQTVADFIRDPYVLEFAGLAEFPQYQESTLEATLPKPEEIRRLIENDRVYWKHHQSFKENIRRGKD